MAKNRASIFEDGRDAGIAHTVAQNPYKADSWQANAWSDGWRAGVVKREADKAAAAAEAGFGQSARDAFDAKAAACRLTGSFMSDPEPVNLGVSALAPFPPKMPYPTRTHIARLNADALTTKDSTRALRLDAKINKLYAKYV